MIASGRSLILSEVVRMPSPAPPAEGDSGQVFEDSCNRSGYSRILMTAREFPGLLAHDSGLDFRTVFDTRVAARRILGGASSDDFPGSSIPTGFSPNRLSTESPCGSPDRANN